MKGQSVEEAAEGVGSPVGEIWAETVPSDIFYISPTLVGCVCVHGFLVQDLPILCFPGSGGTAHAGNSRVNIVHM